MSTKGLDQRGPELLLIGDWQVRPADGVIQRGETSGTLRPLSMKVLVYLAQRAPQLVTTDELIDAVWSPRVVSDGSVAVVIRELRKALGDDTRNPTHIETVSRRGYRVIAPVKVSSSSSSTVPYASDSDQELSPYAGGLATFTEENGEDLLGRETEMKALWEKQLRLNSHHASSAPAQPISTRRIRLATVGGGLLVIVLLMGSLMLLRLDPPLVREEKINASSDAATESATADIAASVPKDPSIAVLPLVNLSGDPDQVYFTDGMTEALTAELGQLSALRVISRTSAMRYRGTNKPLPEIAMELGADALIEGSVLKAGDEVRITLQLVDGATDQHLWSDSYERELRDVLALQRDVARAIAEEIEITLGPEEEARLASARPVDPAAYEDYLRGQYEWNKLTPEGWQAAIEHFQRSIQRDPSYSPAHAMMSTAYSVLGYYTRMPPSLLHSRALAAAERAVALDSTAAEAHASLAMVKTFFDWDWIAADRASREAVRLNPNAPIALLSRGFYLSWIGRHDEAIAVQRRAVELDPVAPWANSWLGALMFMARRYDEAIWQINKVLALDPDYHEAYLWLCFSYAKKGMYEEAARASKRLSALRPRSAGPAWIDAWIVGIAGEPSRALEILEQIPNSSAPTSRYFRAAAFGEAGETDRAIRLLQEAYQGRSPLIAVLKIDPRIDALRDDPRFQDLIRRMNFPD